MDSVNKTMYIPLYGKAFVSRKGIILHDPAAERIWDAEGFPLKGKSRSKWLAYYMGMRSAVFDRWVKARMEEDRDAVVVQIGCGMDSRVERINVPERLWFDVDFPEVIAQRKRYYRETEAYQMIGGDAKSPEWLSRIPGGKAIVVMEGVSMYLSPEELKETLGQISSHFQQVYLLMDCYTQLAARASRMRNPVNDVGVTRVYGMDDPHFPIQEGLEFLRELEMTPEDLISQLHGMEKGIFRFLYAGSVAKKMYRLYEYG